MEDKRVADRSEKARVGEGGERMERTGTGGEVERRPLVLNAQSTAKVIIERLEEE